MKEVLENLKRIRKQKGYSHEYIAQELDISQAAYSKLEKNETKLTVDRLFRLAEILETAITDLLGVNTNIEYNQSILDSPISHHGAQNLHKENKAQTHKIIELYEARLKDKDQLIERLEQMLK